MGHYERGAAFDAGIENAAITIGRRQTAMAQRRDCFMRAAAFHVQPSLAEGEVQ